jgi:small subunit ribosomal protein S21
MSIWKETGWVNDNDTGRNFKGTMIYVKNNDVNKALRKFKKRLQDEGWFNELRKREHYTSPSEQRRKDHAASVVRERKRVSQWNSEQ